MRTMAVLAFRCTVSGLSVHADLRLAAGAEPLGLDGSNACIPASAAGLRGRWRTDLPLRE